jgi:hypothetical protein
MCSDSPSPDPLIGQAAKENADLAREALQYYRERDTAQAPRQARMDDLTERIAAQGIASSQFNDKMARDQFMRYEANGIPAENAMYADAAGYDSKANLDQAAGEASNDVAAAMAKAHDSQQRNLARSGVNPADGRSIAAEQDLGANTALAEAAAMNGARNQRRQMGVMLRKDAASFARGAPGTAAQTFGTSMAAGGQASGAVGAAIGSANATTQTMGQGFNTAIAGNNSAGSMLNQEYANNINANSNSGLLSGLGSLGAGVGAAGGIGKFFAFSDEEMKEHRAPVSGKAALKGIKRTDVEQWNYKPGTEADDGGQPHIGAMAQDMEKNLGPVVSDGKRVDIISAIGVNMAATKALAEKVDNLAAKVGTGKRAAQKGVTA